MNKNKILYIKLDDQKGDTPLERLMSWLRRRNIRIMAVIAMLVLIMCAVLFMLHYIIRLDEAYNDLLGGSAVFWVMLIFVYLSALIWMILLVIRPDMCLGMKRLKRLGNLDKFAGDMEEDLASEGVVFFKNGVCVTKRFIIEASLSYFRVYPLEGLREIDDRNAHPIFHYENGASCKVVTQVPFSLLMPCINTEGIGYAESGKPEVAVSIKPGKPKLRKGDTIIGLMAAVSLTGILLYILFFRLSALETREMALCFYGALLAMLSLTLLSEIYMKTRNSDWNAVLGLILFIFIAGLLFCLLYFNVFSLWGTRLAIIYCWGVFLWLAEFVVIAGVNNSRRERILSSIKEPVERVRKMEELYAEGWFKNRVWYLNRLSALYYENQDFNRALELVQEAIRIQSCKREVRLGSGPTLWDVLRLNQIVCLAALEQLEKVEPLLVPYHDKKYKNPVNMYIINGIRAEIAIKNGDAKSAREYIGLVSRFFSNVSVDERQVNIALHLLLLEAECDLIEKNPAAAFAKLDEVLKRSTWQPNIKRAAKLKK